MKFSIVCEYQITANNYVTSHSTTATIEAPSADRAVAVFLDDLASAFSGVVTNVHLTCSISHDVA